MSARKRGFTKTLTCPPSEDVALSQSRELPRNRIAKIARHITGCEFCAAEQSFLSAYAPIIEENPPSEMPRHLRRLAEALLNGRLRSTRKTSVLRGEGPFAWDLFFAFERRARGV